MKRAAIAILLLVIATPAFGQLKVPDAEQVVGPPHGTPAEGSALDRHAAEVASHLRCPVCQGLSIADSPSAMAINMRGQVRELVARGYDDDQVDRYFVNSYGEFVLLKPKFHGAGAVVWVLPGLLLIGGLLIIVFKVKSMSRPASEAPVSEASNDPYTERVRQLVEKP